MPWWGTLIVGFIIGALTVGVFRLGQWSERHK